MINVLDLNPSISSILFLVIVGILIWYTFSIIYHFIRFGVGRKSKIIALIFFIGSIILFNATLNAYNKIIWSEFIQYIKDILLLV
ncbi:hypothetical protein AMJ48_01915 [Parcubacteria bacterium DG_74_1]|nr:MAG: hypothetical protein AMJ48_01915 [Parcubacteria bacterium DG_74_1]